jgi:hypothetical protein
MDRNKTHQLRTTRPFLTALALLLGMAMLPAGQGSKAADDDIPLDVVAASVRDRGYTCEDPKEAKRDEAASKPDEAAWLIDCGNARYRVIYKGDAGVDVEQVD